MAHRKVGTFEREGVYARRYVASRMHVDVQRRRAEGGILEYGNRDAQGASHSWQYSSFQKRLRIFRCRHLQQQ